MKRRCRARVYRREQLRRTGRGKSGFKRHYTRDRCHRAALPGQLTCWQHASDPMLICGHFKSEDCACEDE
jgi:hypothetical protein